MSGARTPSDVGAPDANGASVTCALTLGARVPPNRCPASKAMRASNEMAATPHGRAEAVVRGAPLAMGCVPTAVPHRWQKRAPGVSSDRQPEQIASVTAAPHSEQ